MTEDGGIVRRIKVKGEGFNNPNDGAMVHGKDSQTFTIRPFTKQPMFVGNGFRVNMLQHMKAICQLLIVQCHRIRLDA